MKKVFEGYTISSAYPIWTNYNSLNLCSEIQKNWAEAYIRYAEFTKNKIKKVRIIYEEIE